MNFALIIGILIAIIWIVIASFKRITVLISAPIATLVVVFFGQLDFINTFFNSTSSYMAYFTDFIFNFFLVFVLGSIMAKYLQKSGAIETISESVLTIIDVHKPMHGMLAVYFITAILTYGGVALFVVMFAVVPLAKSLFNHMQIPWKLSPIPIILGLGTFTASMLPGSPSIINLAPTTVLDTTLMAAPVMGLITSVVCVITSIIYMAWVIKKETGKVKEIITFDLTKKSTNKPTLIRSITPLILLVLIIIVGSIINVPKILNIALVVVILVEAVLFHSYIDSHVDTINTGTSESLIPLLSTSSTIAFGQVVANIGYIADVTRNFIIHSSSKLMSAALLTIVFSLITGSASGAIAIIVPTYGNFLQTSGITVDVIHRVLALSSTIMPNTPHSGVVLALLTLSKLSHKEAFKHVFLAPAVSGFASLVVALLIA